LYRKTPELVEANMDHMIPWSFCDANYTEDPCNQKSTSRYIFILAGGPIAWNSKKASVGGLIYYGRLILCTWDSMSRGYLAETAISRAVCIFHKTYSDLLRQHWCGHIV